MFSIKFRNKLFSFLKNHTMNIVSLYTESTPNPESMKFVVNRYLLPNETREYTTPQQAEESPLAQSLFAFDFVRSVFISNNYITILKTPDTDWNEIIPELKVFLKGYLEAGKEVIIATAAAPTADDDNEMVRRIKDILTDYVQPAVEQDGGAISFYSFDEPSGKLTVKMQGSCSGCPSSVVTLKQGIENLMQRMVPQVKEVVAAD
jgi:Fe-S cluster biogenesis protein NfuA